MDEKLKYEDAKQVVHENIDECIEYWNNEQSIKTEIKTKLLEVLNELKKCSNLYSIGNKAINEYDKINSDKNLMGGLNNDMKERTLGVFWGQIYKLRVLIKSMDIATRDKVANCFKDIITIGQVGEGWRKVIKVEDKFRDTPGISFEHITNGGDGNSFIFATSLVKLLHENGVRSEIVAGTRSGRNRYAVMYVDEGENGRKENYVADPYDEIRKFAMKNIISEEERGNAYTEKIEKAKESSEHIRDNSRLSMDEFLSGNDFVWRIGNPYEFTQAKVDEIFKEIDKKILARNDKNQQTAKLDVKPVDPNDQNNEDR